MTVSAPRYTVYTKTSDTHTVNVYRGDVFESAKRSANFWDERQDTWLFDRLNLSPSQRIDLGLIEMSERVEEAVKNIRIPDGFAAERALRKAARTLAGVN